MSVENRDPYIIGNRFTSVQDTSRIAKERVRETRRRIRQECKQYINRKYKKGWRARNLKSPKGLITI